VIAEIRQRFSNIASETKKRGCTVEKEKTIAPEITEELTRLKRLARKTRNVKLRQRYDIIRLYLSERPKPEIAAILDVSLTRKGKGLYSTVINNVFFHTREDIKQAVQAFIPLVVIDRLCV
jgi:hypothetical protein